MGTFYDAILKPALVAVGLPASRPATDAAPASRGARLHDLRHTFAVLPLSAGVHFMQVSKWLGHSTFTLIADADPATQLRYRVGEPDRRVIQR
jgi:integrase